MTAKNGNISLILKLVLALAVVVVVGFFALQRFSDIAIVDEVTRGEALNAVPGSVTVYADKGFRDFKLEVGGRVAQCDLLAPNKAFKKGEVMLELDTYEAKRDLEEFERNFKYNQEKRTLGLKNNTDRQVAKENLENAERVYKRGDVSKDMLTTAQRAMDAINYKFEQEEADNKKAIEDYNSALDLKKRQLEKMRVVALEDGVVEGVTTWPGALIAPGTSLATFTSKLRVVKAKISEENIGSVKIGQEATVRLLVYPSETFKAKVSDIMGSADETQRFEIYLDVQIDPERLKHNQTGQVTVTVDKHPDRPLVPRRAIFNGANVYVVKDGRVELRKIKVGFVSLNRVEVLEGLTPGELVISENIDLFRDGQRVRVQKTK
jgi:RND family efflux transporter MFP subunit